MKLVVQVPCLNEEETLPLVLSTIPKEIPVIDEIVVLIIDDGSTDRTVEVAREHGTYQLIRQSLSLGAEPIPETKLKTNVEIKSASFECREAAPAKSSDGKSSG